MALGHHIEQVSLAQIVDAAILGGQLIDVVAEGLLDLGGLALAHEAVVHVDAGEAVADGALHEGRFEDGLTKALEEVSAVLVAHFPESPEASRDEPNQLPDEPVLR